MEIKVIDSIMGSGKTSAAINYMNSRTDKIFMYVTPFLEEVQRIKNACNKNEYRLKDKYFYEPNVKCGSKTNSLEFLISHGRNIVTTHAMFKRFNPKIIEAIRLAGYELILDEVSEVIEPLDKINDYDIEDLITNYLVVGDKAGLVGDPTNQIMIQKEYLRV